jgi:hypothetical protein
MSNIGDDGDTWLAYVVGQGIPSPAAWRGCELIRRIASIVGRLRSRATARPAPPIEARAVLEQEAPARSSYFHGTSKPYTRWWWLAGPFRTEDIRAQLAWLRESGFGGVELAWLWPAWMGRDAEPGIEWLGTEWAELVAFTKREADRLGLGCDFTFGSCWPFGGSAVQPEDAARTFDGVSHRRLRGSWEDPHGHDLRVLNHLSKGALRRYAEAMLPAFSGGLRGSTSALFCDSLEIDTWRLWDPALWEPFAARFGYRLEGLEDQIDDDADLCYDYRTLIAETILREFYQEFAAICHEHGAYSRVQCHGAPTDLISAYAMVDIPESEAILFPPHFSRIAASAAALAGKSTVSAETFTCLYGFPTQTDLSCYRYWRREQTADLKLLADALFAQGINHITWHGMPFNEPGGRNEFYASVHVGPDSAFAADLPAFNDYLTRVSSLLKLGRTESRLAIYLPNEDNRRLGLIPDAERTPGSNFRWEMRHVVVARETEGYMPLWISGAFLERAEVRDGLLCIGQCAFPALLVDVGWLDGSALEAIVRLAEAGLRVILRRLPEAPGKCPRPDYSKLLATLQNHGNVVDSLDLAGLAPVVAGDDLPPFWARRTTDFLYLFFAHPKARELGYPLSYGQSLCRQSVQRNITIQFEGASAPLDLVFKPYQSLLVRMSRADGVRLIDIAYTPPEPLTSV